MKRLFTTLVLCALLLSGFVSGTVQAQGATFEFVNPPESTILTATTNEVYISHYLYIKNKSMFLKRLRVIREINQLAPNQSVVFCFGGSCMLPEQDSSIIFEMKPNETTSQIDAFNPKVEDIYDHPGTTVVTYTIYDIDDPSDKLTVTFTYIVSVPTDIRMPFDIAPVTVLSNAFPSPAFDNTRIDYNIAQHYSNASITVYNLIGNPIQTFRVDTPKGNVTLPTSDLAPGVYFYSIVADGKKLATKKLVVKR